MGGKYIAFMRSEATLVHFILGLESSQHLRSYGGVGRRDVHANCDIFQNLRVA